MLTIPNMQGAGVDLSVGRLVVKLGSAVVMAADGKVDQDVLAALADAIAWLRSEKVEVIVVTSGSIGVGCRLLGRPRPKTLPEKQAVAAIGQISLMHTYQRILAERGLLSAQLLLTRNDMDDRRRYLNVRYAMERILDLGAVPIINENDTTATEEISFGDNDGLSAYVAVKMKADLLMLLSSVDGLHPGVSMSTGKPKGDPVPVVEKIDESTYEWSARGKFGRDSGGHGTGGMLSKLDAARTATGAGVHTVIANGKNLAIVREVLSGSFRGTFFPARRDASISARGRWIGFGRASRGNRLRLDSGAVEALARKKTSLLPVGVVAVEGTFDPGDVVELCGPDGAVIGRGLVNYSAEEIDRVKGCRSADIKSILGHRDYDEIVHRDNMVLL